MTSPGRDTAMEADGPDAAIEQAIAHYPFSDTALFREAYEALAGLDLKERTVIEVCCGEGSLAAWLANIHPGAMVHGIDYWEGHVETARRLHGHLPNLHFRSGDALRLDDFADGSVGLVVGQATLHHLSNNLPGAAREFSRILESGGHCIFIFEPLGHNPLFAAIRGILNSRRQWIDESMLFVGALEEFGKSFATCSIRYHNLLNYAAKLLPRKRILRPIPEALRKLDRTLLDRCPRLRRHAANCNIFYRK